MLQTATPNLKESDLNFAKFWLLPYIFSKFSFFYRIAIKSYLVASLKRFLSSFTHHMRMCVCFFPSSTILCIVKLSVFFFSFASLQTEQEESYKESKTWGMIAHGK